jgi:uncharacterized protein (TIGR03086 family)
MRIELDSVVELDRRAVLGSVAVVDRVREEDLERPTPCAGWTVRDLLAHMTVQHHGFAAAARGNGADPAAWAAPASVADDPVAAYRASAGEVLAAFGERAGHRFVLPEVSTDVDFSPVRAIGFHLVDYVVHGWDVARAIGVAYEPDGDLLDAARRQAEAVPDGPQRSAPGAAFAPPVPVLGTATPLDRVLATLGRSPTWEPT